MSSFAMRELIARAKEKHVYQCVNRLACRISSNRKMQLRTLLVDESKSANEECRRRRAKKKKTRRQFVREIYWITGKSNGTSDGHARINANCIYLHVKRVATFRVNEENISRFVDGLKVAFLYTLYCTFSSSSFLSMKNKRNNCATGKNFVCSTEFQAK